MRQRGLVLAETGPGREPGTRGLSGLQWLREGRGSPGRGRRPGSPGAVSWWALSLGTVLLCGAARGSWDTRTEQVSWEPVWREGAGSWAQVPGELEAAL